jgi:hypothetical protein
MDLDSPSARLSLLRPTPTPLHLSVNVTDDWIEAIEFGAVVDGRPPSQLVEISDDIRYVLRSARGPVAGFTVHRFSRVDLDDVADDIFGEPRFFVPLLGLDRASLGEVVLAARARFEVSTADVCFFMLALACAEDEGDLEGAAGHWLSCVESGDMRGHFGLGYTLYDLGRHREAYGHLRRYTELAPHNSWAWLWLGRAADGIGEIDEARSAYRRAIRREREGSFRTDALERLKALEKRIHGTA